MKPLYWKLGAARPEFSLRVAVISCITSIILGPFAFAWDAVGHIAVAGLAYDELSQDQQSRLVAILKKHPRLNFITEGFSAEEIDDRDLVMAAATWPDLARGKTSSRVPKADQIKDNGYEENSPAVEKVDYRDGLLHRGWHFIDTPLWVGNGSAPEQLPPAPAVNAVAVVNVLIRQVKSNEDDKERAYDLAWLMHLVGDLHQPLHAVNGISDTLPDGDSGGNSVNITGTTEGASELHAFWDDILGKTAKPDRRTGRPRLDQDAAVADEVITSVQRLSLRNRKADDLDPADWASESLQLAKKDAYNLNLEPFTIDRRGKDVEIMQAELDDSYEAAAKRDARKRVRLAGHRFSAAAERGFIATNTLTVMAATTIALRMNAFITVH